MPVTLNDIAALVNVPVTVIVLPTDVHTPVKSMNELHESVPRVKLLASESLSVLASLVESDGLNVIFNETAYPYTAGVNC